MASNLRKGLTAYSSLAEVLRSRANEKPDLTVLTFLSAGEAESERLSYSQLDCRARAIGGMLQGIAAPGERAQLLYPPGLELVAALFGCLYAGVIAAPAYPPHPNRSQARLHTIFRNARPKVVLTNSALLAKSPRVTAQMPPMRGVPWIATDVDKGDPAAWKEPSIGPDSLAFLQYSSGSTAAPKGVMLSHANLLHNLEIIRRAFQQSEESVIVGWLPLYHDMGLIGNVLQPLCLGARCYLMPPMAFLSKPVRWLQAITRYRATTSGGPNFAYDLCVRKISAQQKSGLDLHTWRVAFNGAEPVRATTLERFAAAFAPVGFRKRAFFPCYGLAEATLFVTGGSVEARPKVKAFATAALEQNQAWAASGRDAACKLVSCGWAAGRQVVKVVDPSSNLECREGQVGEVWIGGPSVAKGYWCSEQETRRNFGARLAKTGEDGQDDGPFLRSGDLGLLQDGELFITGRLKDLIIIRGRNHYPQDIEQVVERSHPAFRRGCGAAFSLELAGQERLVVAQELERGREKEAPSAVDALREAVARERQVQVFEVVLLRIGTLPKTSSGKIMRHACRSFYLGKDDPAHLFQVIWRDRQPVGPAGRGDGSKPVRTATDNAQAWRGGDSEMRRAGLLDFIRSEAAQALGLAPAQLTPGRPLTALGLDSLTALELRNSLEGSLGVRISFSRLLKGATIEQLAARIADSPPPSAVVQPPAQRSLQAGAFPLSWGQRSLWLLERLAEEAPVNHIAIAARVLSPLDSDALRRALSAVVQRHPMLRCAVSVTGESPVQAVRGKGEWIDYSEQAWPPSERLAAKLCQQAYRPFDLKQDPLVRLSLWRRPQESLLVLAIHHIAADFWSLSLMAGELEQLYRQESGGPPALLAEPDGGYADFVAWQARLLKGSAGERLQRYWRRQLSGKLPALELPTDRPRPALQSYRGSSRSLPISPERTESLAALARAEGCSLFSLLLAAFQVLLHRWSGQDEILTGSPASGRSATRWQGVLGYFVNPIVLRADLAGDPPFPAFLAKTRETVTAALEHQDYPFALLAEKLQPKRDPSRAPLFQAMFVFQQARSAEQKGLAAFSLGESGQRLRIAGLELESVALAERAVQYDLALSMAAAEDGSLCASLAFNRDLFDALSAARLLSHLAVLLGGLAASPGRRVSQFPLLEPAERRQILQEWNDTRRPLPRQDAYQLFAARAAQAPESAALTQGGHVWTYAGLKQRSCQIADRLQHLGAGPEVQVALLLGRTPLMVAALLAALRRGAPYLPLDPSHPRRRLCAILDDAGASLLLAQSATLPVLEGSSASALRVVLLDELPALQRRPAATPQSSPSDLANLAYLIYTSGSTGRPKGVQISRLALTNFLAAMASRLKLTRQDVLLAATTLSFDISALELLLPLLAGARLTVADRRLASDGPALAAALDDCQATFYQATPAGWRLLLAGGWPGRSGMAALCGGEALDHKLADEIAQRCGRLWNLYGPTESTVWSALHRFEGDSGPTVPIGRPIDNTQLYVLDRQLRLLPIGVTGELFIAGEGLARGYWKRPALTAERFLPHPLAEPEGAPGRLYRTGDLARFRPDGEIEFLGRTDHQVKLRGHRIELGEIEALLSEHSLVRQAAVVADAQGSETRLLACLVLKQGGEPAISIWRGFLSKRLPAYMLPSAFLCFSALPLGPSGKVDRRALLAQALRRRGRPQLAHSYSEPKGPLQESLAAIWAELLGVERVGANDDFLELGGHSLLGVRMIARIRRQWGAELTLRQVFERPGLASLARQVEALLRQGMKEEPETDWVAAVRPPEEGPEEWPLSLPQQRLWFVERLQVGSAAYNLAGAGRLSGPLDPALLEAALGEVVRRHEPLRTIFEQREEKPVQVVRRSRRFALPVIDLEGIEAPQRRTQERLWAQRLARSPFQVSAGPLLRAALLRLGPADHCLTLCLHHLVADGRSVQLLHDELARLYRALAAGRPSPLSRLPLRYADFAVWQRRQLQEGALQPQLDFWSSQLRGAPLVLELPTDRPRPAVQSLAGAHCRALLSEDLRSGLEALGRQRGATLFMTLLAGFLGLISRHAGRSDFLLATPVENRSQDRLQGLIGLFANLIVLRAKLQGDPCFEEALDRLRQASLDALAHQDLPYERLVEQLQPQRDLSRPPLVQVVFAFQEALPQVSFGNLGWDFAPLDTGTAKFDLTLVVEEARNGLKADLEYSTDLYDASTARRLLRHYTRFLEEASRNPSLRLSALPILSAGERHQVEAEWSGRAESRIARSEARPGQGLCVEEQFEAQAAHIPQALAVAASGLHLSYGELERQSARLARRLRSLCGGAEPLVALWLERSPQLVVGALGALRAGAAYLPLDPDLPVERIGWLLRDSEAQAVVSQQRRLRQLPSGLAAAATRLPLDGLPPLLEGSLQPGKRRPADRQQMAYLIYTSGSAGFPKGVEIPHGGLANLVRWHRLRYGLQSSDRASLIASPGFDASVWEMWPCLASGSSLHIPSEETRASPARLARWLAGHSVTVAFLPTPLARAALQQHWPRRLALRLMLTGGDRLARAPQTDFPFQLINHYGPTESSVVATAGRVCASLQQGRANPPPIGRPISGLRVYVLDGRLRPQPIGPAGELCIGGKGLAQAYRKQPQQTAERFVPDPFSSEGGERLYRSGDRVRWLADGNLDFLGRLDDQVKLRGFRIEPGEVEAALSRQPDVAEAAVIAQAGKDGQQSLAAFVAAHPGRELQPEKLRSELRRQLPGYMVPQTLTLLESLPLTPRGKIDRQKLSALPLPPSERPPRGAPATHVEEVLVQLCAQLLEREDISINDSFFAMGGHSLLAAKLLSRVQGQLEAEIPLRAVFEASTLGELARQIETASAAARDPDVPPLLAQERSQRIPLSFAQERLWFLGRLEPDSPAYNISGGARLEGDLDFSALEGALSKVVDRHEALRTTFSIGHGRPYQVIAPSQRLSLPLCDLRLLANRERQARQLASAEARRTFDLGRGPLFRFTLLRLAKQEHLLLATFHHIVSDGWSMDVFFRETASLYRAFQGRGDHLAAGLGALPVQYADYAIWQRRWLQGEILGRHLTYWRQQLSGMPPLLDLPSDRPRPPRQSYAGASLGQDWPKELEADLDRLCRSHGSTRFMAILAAFQALLARWTGRGDIAVGVPVANRSRSELEGLIGLFVNTLVLRTRLSDEAAFAAVLERVKEAALQAFAHQSLPFERLVEELQPQRSGSHSPLVQVLLVLQGRSRLPPRLTNLRVAAYESPSTTAKFDLTLFLRPRPEGGWQALLEYSTDLFEATTARRMLGHLRILLQGAASCPDQPVGELPLLSRAEQSQLRQWNDTRVDRPPSRCLHEWVEAQADETPDASAVSFDSPRWGQMHLSYAGLARQSSQLAGRLARAGLQSEAAAGICTERSLEMVIGLLGILKAGGPYLPLDPSYPQRRLSFMLEDAAAPSLLTQDRWRGLFPDYSGTVISLDEIGRRPDFGTHGHTLPKPLDPDSLAYLIYTSGSTGRPKGVMSSHGGIVNRLLWGQAAFGLSPGDRVLHKTPLNFDVSVWELFWPLMIGAHLSLARPGGHRDGSYLAHTAARQGVTALHFVPSMLKAFLEVAGLERQCRSLRCVFASGEAVTAGLQARYFSRLETPLQNLYGPTEASVEVTHWECDPHMGQPTVPIGRPIANCRIHLLDHRLGEVPLGVTGELFIGGVCLARGYWRRPGLTAQSFLPDPFAGSAQGWHPGSRVYRSGDLARYLPDGNIDFLGRCDHQVKIRGVRIELGEVEAALAAQPQVQQAAAAAVDDRGEDARLVAFVVGQPGTALDLPALQKALGKTLLEPMMPTAFIEVQALPLNPAGKLDRAALQLQARGARAAPAGRDAFVAPRTPVEELLSGIWCQLLGAERVGIHDNFFELGGHSLLATRMVSRVRQLLGIEPELQWLFERPSLEAFAEQIELARATGQTDPAPPLIRVAGQGPLPLSFAQERLWFLEQLEPGTAAYIISSAVRLRGRLDVPALGGCLAALAGRHESLRTTFTSRRGHPLQVVTKTAESVLPYLDLSNLAEQLGQQQVAKIGAADASRPFNLESGPLWRAALLKMSQSEHVALLAMHHIISDGWSMGILIQELAALYQAQTAASGAPRAPLPHLPVRYRDFARWQRDWLTGPVLQGQLDYWRGRLQGAEVLQLPSDRPRGEAASWRGAACQVELKRRLTRQLADFARRQGATLFMALLSAFGALLARCSGQSQVLIGSPIANRTRTEIEGLIGFFVNTLVLHVDLRGAANSRELVARVRKMALGAYRHQDLPFEKLVEELQPQRNLNTTPLFQVMLVLQNAHRQALSLPGLAIEPVEVEAGRAKFDLTLTFVESEKGLCGSLRYRQDLFDPTTIQRLWKHFERLLKGMMAHPGRSCSQLPLQGRAERHQLVVECNDTSRPASRPGSFYERFQAWAQRTPDTVAVVFEGSGAPERRLSYSQLDLGARRLAHRLKRLGVGPESRVAIRAERSDETIAALLGVFAAGGAYLPLAAGLPKRRLEFLLQDAAAAVLLTQARFSDELENPSVANLSALCLDSDRSGWPALASPSPALPESLAYVTYTSGSTGTPKGVAVEQRHLLNYLDALLERLQLQGSSSFATVSSLAADLGNSSIFGSLGSGGCLHVVAQECIADPIALGEYFRCRPVDVLKIVPSHLEALLSSPHPQRVLPGRWLILGGEACHPELARRVRQMAPGCRLLNHYGPTEATVGVATHRISRDEAWSVPLGRPMPNSRIYLLDSAGSPVPIGLHGELCIAGQQLARGYIGQAGLTAASFQPDPCSLDRPGARLYRSGDLARRRPDGCIEFRGRIDHQLKIRGFRVEAGEIEAVLRMHPQVRESALVPWQADAGGLRLAAYLAVENDAAQPALGHLIGFLKDRLPSYMVPDALVFLPALPRLPNGKIDRSSMRLAACGGHPGLPAPERPGGKLQEAALTPAAELVAELWASVLGRAERPQANDNFFDQGGHSLLATRLISRLQQSFGVHIPVRALFEEPSLAALADRISAALQGPRLKLPPLVRLADREDPPLSFAQQRLWILDQLSPGQPGYNLPYFVRLRGRLHHAALAHALGVVLQRHEGLRTVFPLHQGRPIQRVRPYAAPALPLVDLAALPEAKRQPEAERIARAEAARPFDLARGPLWRSAWVRIQPADSLLLLNLHHIISDAWSRGILIREAAALYAAALSGRASPLPELPLRYTDFARWQRKCLSGETLDSLIGFWRPQVESLPALELPYDRLRSASAGQRGATVGLAFSPGLSASLKACARREGATLFMALLAAFKMLLARCCQQADLAVGTSIANRNRPEIESLIGFFVNTLLLRTRLAQSGGRAPISGPSFQEALDRVRQVTLAAYAHQDLPFEMLAQEFQAQRGPAAAPLIQAMLVLQNAPGSALQLPEMEIEPLEVHNGRAKFELTVVLEEAGQGLQGLIEYDCGLFDAATVRRLSAQFGLLLAEVAADPGKRLFDLPLLSAPQRHQLLQECNATQATYPRRSTIHQLCALQAARRPDRVALACGERQLSYCELEARADYLAQRLGAEGIRPDVPVGLRLERCLEMVPTIMGILKAGGAYLPLDPGYPAQRLAFMLEDSRTPLLLADSLPDAKRRTILLGTVWAGDSASQKKRPLCRTGPDNLAYVMYTSGSTGRPKGVAIAHRAVVRLVCQSSFAALGSRQVFLQYAPISFDASTLEIWAPLLNGGRLAVAPRRNCSLQELGALLARHSVTALWLTAGLFHRIVEEDPLALRPLQQLLAGGDALSALHCRRLLEALPATTLINGYGPTENTTFTCCHSMRDPQAIGCTVPIGRPISNTRAYLLDRLGQPVPMGVAGHLMAGGDGLARGYLHRPALTGGAFVPDPCSGIAGSRLYRTGDLARCRADGRIEFLGRCDRQLKLRGFRIEPGEIESHLNQCPAVREAVVVIRPDAPGGKGLVAYLARRPGKDPRPDEALTDAELRDGLRRRLPEYMMPAAFEWLDALPLNPNGKIDREALPPPSGRRRKASEPLAAPADPVQELLAGIWADVLGLDAVGIHDDFFALGGNSLQAIQAVSRLRKTLGVELPLQVLFEKPMVAALAGDLSGSAWANKALRPPPLSPRARRRRLPLSFAQERLWFLDQLQPGSAAYHIAAAIRFKGPLDAAALQASFNVALARHEALRTCFSRAGAEPVQIVLPRLEAPLRQADLRALAKERRQAESERLLRAESRRPFQLEAAPLLRILLLRAEEGEHLLLVVMHHIISDGWSVGVLIRELAALYLQFTSGQPASLPDLPIQYPDYSLWQREWLSGEALQRQLSYWQERLQDVPQLHLPLDHPRPSLMRWRGGRVEAALPKALSAKLTSLSHRQGVTLFMLLLAAFKALLMRYAGQADLAVGTPSANRSHLELEGLIGFFVNTLVIRTDLPGGMADRGPTFRELLALVRQGVLQAYAHQDLPFEKLVSELPIKRDLSATPLFQAMFILQNMPWQAPRLPGLRSSMHKVDIAAAKFELTLALAETQEGLEGTLEYASELFDRSTMRRLAGHFRNCLEGACADLDRPILELPFLSAAQRLQTLAEWNPIGQVAGPTLTLTGLFQAQALRTPDAQAVAWRREGLSYRELDARSNRLARLLRRWGVRPEMAVGILLERSAQMVVALLATLKAGGAYLPLDPAYPPQRLAWLVQDAGARLLLTARALLDALPAAQPESGFGGCRRICLDRQREALSKEPSEGLRPAHDPQHLAYLIYTSGSTGQPKGVSIEHRSAAVLAYWARDAFSDAELSGVLASTSICFDLSVFELFVPLSWGGRIILADHALELLTLQKREEVTLVNTVPSAMAELIRHKALPSSVRTVNLAGEALRRSLVEEALSSTSAGRLLNLYGPSEDTTYSTFARLRQGEAGEPSIGRPIANTRAYVLDPNLLPLPPGAAGELCLAGDGLARCYFERPRQTAQSFIPDPCSEAPGGRLYKTGDLARHLPDGRIAFLGREDQQVKVRGFRVELGEVESALLGHPGLQEAAVQVVEEPEDRRLAAYVVRKKGRGEDEIQQAGLRAHLRHKLPEFMVPSFFVFLEGLPRTPNGKLDRRALPNPLQRSGPGEPEKAPPRDALEEVLASLWAEALGLESVGVDDDFFDLGGHSLLATRLVFRLREALRLDLPVRTLFEAPTVAELAEALRRDPLQRPHIERVSELLAQVARLSNQEAQSRLEAVAQEGAAP